jgi:hypothetical protein
VFHCLTVAPTHILALSTPTQPDKSTLFLIHQLPFAANCSSFPDSPEFLNRDPSRQSVNDRYSSCHSRVPSIDRRVPPLPNVPLRKGSRGLRVTFLPQGWADSIDSIMHSAVLIKGFWSNACAFGTLDDEVFDVSLMTVGQRCCVCSIRATR